MKERILYLDIIRALAVIIMVQGHTVDTFLAEGYRTFDSFGYFLWITFRGFTAPVFMFTSGAVFTYLLINGNPEGINRKRVIKGIKRFFLLLGLGYLLRYPTHRIIDFSYVTEQGWKIFFAADALHLIAFGILAMVILYLAARKTGIDLYLLTGLTAAFFIFTSPMIRAIDWQAIVPLPIAAYFYKDTGSIFPLFPYIGYVLAGGLLGNFIASNKGIFKSIRLSRILFAAAGISIILSLVLYYSGIYGSYTGSYFGAGPQLTFFRLSFVLLLNGGVSYFALKINSVPDIVKLTGRHTLLIYVVHSVILYGSAWNIGFYQGVGHKLSFFQTVFMVILMISAMVYMVHSLEKFRVKRAAAKLS